MYIDPEKKIQASVLRCLSIKRKNKLSKKEIEYPKHLARLALLNANFDDAKVGDAIKEIFRPFRPEYACWFSPDDFHDAMNMVLAFTISDKKWRKECQGLAARLGALSA